MLYFQPTRQAVHQFFWSHLSRDRRARRHREIVAACRSRRNRPTYLVIGDSVAQSAELPEITGHLGVNAGLGGAKVGSFLYAKTGLRYANSLRPKIIVLALGLNDSRSTSPETFEGNYRDLIRDLKGYPLVAAEITPCAHDTTAHNEVIRSIANGYQIPCISLAGNGSTTDGLHLDAASMITWTDDLAAALSPRLVRELAPSVG